MFFKYLQAYNCVSKLGLERIIMTRYLLYYYRTTIEKDKKIGRFWIRPQDIAMALDDIFNLWLRGLSWRFVCLSGPSLKELRQEKVGDQTEIVHHQIAPRAISSWAEIEKQPYFLPTTTVITIQEGGHAFFTCKVENLYNQTVRF